jgi:hypothetical protein
MAARVTAAEIAEICELDPTITSLTPFIRPATLIVDEDLEPLGELSAARLKEIELYLAAHFYSVRDPKTQSESAGVSVSYEGSSGVGLKRTRYGQQAIVLDSTGTLSSLDNAAPQKRMIFESLGVDLTGDGSAD